MLVIVYRPPDGPLPRRLLDRRVDGVGEVAVQVLSVNVGRPRTVQWRGRPVSTSIWKAPVPGRVSVGRTNVDGDAQADLVGHGGEHRAVYVYQLESYRYWERELGRLLDGHGVFGENLTVTGLADDEVRIGDRLGVGTTVLEVTQPRVTCYKVGIRLDEPRMPALLTGHGRPGFYVRVLQEGDVGAGDDVRWLARGPAGLTVARVSALLYTPGALADDAALLERAIASPALSEGWKGSFRQLLASGGSGPSGGGNAGLTGAGAEPPAYAGFRPFRVARVVRETPSVRSFVLEPADGTPLPRHRAGQFVAVRVPDGRGGALSRSYSLSAAPDGATLRLSVKRDGAASALLHDRVGAGATVELAAPRGGFVLPAPRRPADAPAGAPAGGTAADDRPRPLVLISAGIGVTPVLAMLQALVAEGSRRPVTWVHVTRSGDEHAFAVEVAGLLARLPAARSHVRYTRPLPSDRLGIDFDAAGRVTREALAALDLSADAEAFVCGPAAFMADVGAALTALGLDPAAVRTEAFGAAEPPVGAPPPHLPAGPPADGPTVTFSRTGLTVRFGQGRWQSLLELAEDCDVPVGWSCRTGVCHRCETGLVAGDVGYEPAPLDPPATGSALLCCASPRTDVTLDL